MTRLNSFTQSHPDSAPWHNPIERLVSINLTMKLDLLQFTLPRNWLLFIFAYLFWIIAAVYYIFPYLHLRLRVRKKDITIMVLGDLGHSPRMTYHALSLANQGYQVNLCGYVNSELLETVMEHELIDVYEISAVANKHMLPFVFFTPYKIVVQIFQLWTLLRELQGSQYYMMQNPPSMPLLAVLTVYLRVCSPNSHLIIDWHNLNYTILNLRFNNVNHPLVRLLRTYERLLARFAWLNITVSDHLKKDLSREFGLRRSTLVTFHDRPGPQFCPLESPEARDKVLDHEIFAGVADIRARRIIVSATSFTPDEDFQILLQALKRYDDNDNEQTPLLALITGKGPLRAQFLAEVDALGLLEKVVVRNKWLSTEDYPRVLAVADLAVSLHTSLSGIDLPMKIVDFFGVGVPVVTLSFPAISELVKDGVNGLVVPGVRAAYEELYECILQIFGSAKLLQTLKSGAMKESERRWDDNWNAVLRPIFVEPEKTEESE